MRASSSRSFACFRLFRHSPPPCVSRLTSLPKSALSATTATSPAPEPSTNVPLFLYRAFTCLVTLIIPEKSILQHLLSPSVPVVLLFRPLRDYARGGSLSCEELGLQVSSRRAWMEIDVNVPRKQQPPVLLSPSFPPVPFCTLPPPSSRRSITRMIVAATRKNPPRASRGS